MAAGLAVLFLVVVLTPLRELFALEPAKATEVVAVFAALAVGVSARRPPGAGGWSTATWTCPNSASSLAGPASSSREAPLRIEQVSRSGRHGRLLE